MLLSRVTKHVKDQNWFAAALDFCIVVAGILIAVQIDAWANRQAVQKSTEASLRMLLADLTLDIERLDLVTEAQTMRIDALQRVSDTLKEPDPNYEEVAEDLNLAVDNSRTLLVRDTVYDTMEKEGQLVVLPPELRRKISMTYGYDFPALATAGLQMDENADEVESRCVDAYWDRELRVPISETREDLARLRNCIINLRGYSAWYLSSSEGQYRQNAEALKTALEIELGIEREL